MPYIKEEQRRTLDPDIERLVDHITEPGEVNYAITRILTKLVTRHQGLNYNYAGIAGLIGTLECVKMELYRRIAAPYEDGKMEQNGDVYEEAIDVKA